MNKFRFLFSFIIVTSSYFSNPQMDVIQSHGQCLDNEIRVDILGLKSNSQYQLKARMSDIDGADWKSAMNIFSDEKGEIHLAANSDEEATDLYFLFGLMKPEGKEGFGRCDCKDDRFDIELILSKGEKNITSKEVSFYLTDPKVTRVEIREDGIVGTLFIASVNKKSPAVIYLSGSGGGISEKKAKLLASNGFNVLALGYFGEEGLPKNLARIPLEYFKNAIKWLKNHPLTLNSKVGLYGVSRGAELSLLIGSIFPNKISGIVAVCPSSVVHSGFSEKEVDAWTYKGKPVKPYTKTEQLELDHMIGNSLDNPIRTLPLFVEEMTELESYEAARIEVEKIRCPILLIAGKKDQMWPSFIYANEIKAKAKKCKLIAFDESGHDILIPMQPQTPPLYFHPMTRLWFDTGGTRKANSEASYKSWREIKRFFGKRLR